MDFTLAQPAIYICACFLDQPALGEDGLALGKLLGGKGDRLPREQVKAVVAGPVARIAASERDQARLKPAFSALPCHCAVS
ncbi:hypothetical protein [Sphingobium sp.]|uniref:hypothetical protein n=1 Tax=Sphingobium sp. TaxID=1912891 RepID=UPI002C9EC32E|nr:hypothetical protein [Sphingobium sp.]HUD90130.1 hypothetical protein [Sphingobium sp.]